jgi:hypothetical protein
MSDNTSEDGVTTVIRIGLPLPMDVVGNVLSAIGERWPNAKAVATGGDTELHIHVNSKDFDENNHGPDSGHDMDCVACKDASGYL